LQWLTIFLKTSSCAMIKSYFFQIFGKDTLFSRKNVVFLP